VVISFIPVIQGISPILWYIFGAWMMAMQYLDIPADNNGISFQQTLEMMRKDRTAVMGFGGAVTLATATPLLNLIIIPIAVAGGVVFWVKRMDQQNLTHQQQKQVLNSDPVKQKLES
ncbi:MAG: hypothetical protein CSA49_00065, partial [Gammaproteobacteria bacterium]